MSRLILLSSQKEGTSKLGLEDVQGSFIDICYVRYSLCNILVWEFQSLVIPDKHDSQIRS